jgi:hypothetical protein
MTAQAEAKLTVGGEPRDSASPEVTSEARISRHGDTSGRTRDPRRNVVLAMFLAIAVTSVLAVALFYLVTVYLTEEYIRITGKLVHEDVQTNKALLHLAAQSSVLGGLGGSLFIMQQLTNYIGRGKLAALEDQHIDNYFLYAFVTPLKGLIAGIVGGCVVGGSIMMVGGMEALGKAHLLVIGCGCIAGYSEQFLQHVVAVADRKVKKL